MNFLKTCVLASCIGWVVAAIATTITGQANGGTALSGAILMGLLVTFSLFKEFESDPVALIEAEIKNDPGDWGSDFIQGLERARNIIRDAK